MQARDDSVPDLRRMCRAWDRDSEVKGITSGVCGTVKGVHESLNRMSGQSEGIILAEPPRYVIRMPGGVGEVGS